MIAPFVSAPGNRNKSPLLREALPEVMRIAREVGMDLQGTIVSLDGVYDCRVNRKAIFNRGMVPNINPNPRGESSPSEAASRSSSQPFLKSDSIRSSGCLLGRTSSGGYCFALTGISRVHYAFKTLAYTMINLRHYCQG